MSDKKLYFVSDYMEGAHPNILKRLCETNYEHTEGYGLDRYSASAVERIREACGCQGAEVKLLVGGTQTNAVVIDAILRSYQGVIAPDSGHIAIHEAGAIERGGHKVLAIPSVQGKINAAQVENYVRDFQKDDNHDHIVMPGMVYISQPTEFGTIYSRKELEELSEVCHRYHLPLYVDGARLAYALASKENDITLPDLASLCDVFYIGGTKCGALFGEAVVIPDPGLIPHFFPLIKQHGALLAKGRILGIQFDELFKDDLYRKIGESAIDYALRIKECLKEQGFSLYYDSPTNQILFIVNEEQMEQISRFAEYSFMEKYDENHVVIRFATSWATREEDVEMLIHHLSTMKKNMDQGKDEIGEEMS